MEVTVWGEKVGETLGSTLWGVTLRSGSHTEEIRMKHFSSGSVCEYLSKEVVSQPRDPNLGGRKYGVQSEVLSSGEVILWGSDQTWGFFWEGHSG